MIAERRAAGLNDPRKTRVERDILLDRFVAGHGVGDELAQFRMQHEILHVAAERSFAVAFEQIRGGRVERDDLLARIDGHHPFDHAGQHGILLAALP